MGKHTAAASVNAIEMGRGSDPRSGRSDSRPGGYAVPVADRSVRYVVARKLTKVDKE